MNSTLGRETNSGPRTLHGLFLETVRRSPGAVAVEVEGGERLTFSELEERSRLLASRLLSHGVGRGSLVAVCLDRSLDLAVGLLGVLRAGAAYVPVDPAYPLRRITLMLEDSGAAVLLAHAETAAALPDTAQTVVRLDSLDEPRGGIPDLAAVEAGREDLAYVIYTSGSTGRPKGVMIPHRALCNFLASMREVPGFDARDTLVSVTTPSFDIFGLELFLPLVTGGRVVLARRSTTADGSALAALLEASGATVVQATPANWRLLVDAGWARRPGPG